jgi:hypothetical protein
MHPNFDARQNVVNHVANAQTFAAHSVACVDTTTKRLLGRKRWSTQAQCPGDSSSGYRPDMSSPRDSMSRGERMALRKPPTAAHPQAAVETPAAIRATLVIARALAS